MHMIERSKTGGTPALDIVGKEVEFNHTWKIDFLRLEDVQCLMHAFEDPVVRDGVYNDQVFNDDHYPDFRDPRQVRMFEQQAADFWIPRINPFAMMTQMPNAYGESNAKDKEIEVGRLSFVIRANGAPAHTFALLDNYPYATEEHRRRLDLPDDDSRKLRVAYKEAMFTMPGKQNVQHGLATFGEIAVNDALLGKTPEEPGPFNGIAILVNVSHEGHTLSYFSRNGYVEYVAGYGSDTAEDPTIIFTTQNGKEVLMKPLYLSRNGWHGPWGARQRRLEAYKRRTGMDYPDV
jgi:hypothetical protein